MYQVGALVVAAAAIIAVVVAITATKGPPHLRPGGPVPHSAEVNALFAGIPESGATLGDPRAPVTLVEFGDLQCPFCMQFARSGLAGIVQRYVRPGKLQIVFRNLTFIGSDSQRAARMAAAAGAQRQLWPFIDLFYANQRTENTRYVTDEFLRAVAGAVSGLDVNRAVAERDAPASLAQIAQARSEQQRFGIRSTPSFLIGRSGQPLQHFNPDGLDTGSFSGKLDQLLRGR